MQKEFRVLGMSCSHCVDKIEKFIGEIDGVSHIDVDLDQKIVSVSFQAPASEKAIIEAIGDAGYEVDQ
ncbi:copper ion binding protein [Helicobacter sp. 11S02596-1]|uniref:heavy-metal-associated domain-containing protein n=1 Tax=Helicobacter sp. 11S02596-1 TaxID=1476194 RepID=UPI000BA68969|nr:copper ion binding protein [Helicobacter sp. 11S02596-1]PAF44741.1 hypothetical protein BJI48_01770 [Helicobacter sp. 11S02596-1]